MATQSEFIDFTETDFSTLKQNLIDYITNTSDFTDQNVEGSNLNLMVSLLAYINEILSYNLNNVINERFLNTAKLRTNVLKLLKTLNYTPYRKQSSTIYLDLYIPYDKTKKNLYLNKYDSVKSGDYIFYYIGEDQYPQVYVQPITGTKFLKYTECEFVEGELIVSSASQFGLRTGDDIEETNEFYTGTGKDYQTYTIFDMEMGEYFRVLQSKDGEVIEWEIFDEKTDYVNASESELFFLEEVDKGYQIEFGNDKLGKAPLTTDVLGYLYIRPSGAEANELDTFEFNNGVDLTEDDFGTTGFIEPPGSSDFMQSSYGGGEKESLEEIRMIAPKWFNTQSRAVTEDDYKTIALRNPLIEKANVIGGQNVISSQTSNKMLGKVYIYVKPNTSVYPSLKFSDFVLDNTLKDYFKEYSVVTIDPIVNNVSYLYYRPYMDLKYITDKAPDEETIKTTLTDYMADEQGQFGEYFEESKFKNAVSNSDPLINSVVFHAEKYVILENGTSIDNPNNFEFKTQSVPAERTGVYKLTLAKYLQKWKIDLRQTIPLLEYNYLDIDADGVALPELTGDGDDLVDNPFYGQRVPATRLETYVYRSVDDEVVPVLTHVSFPFNHPGIDTDDVETGISYLKYYYLMYGENEVATSKEFFHDKAGRAGVDESEYIYDPTVDFNSPIFDWDDEEFNYGVAIDGTTYTRPTGDDAPGKEGKLTLYAGCTFTNETGESTINNLFPMLDFSDLQFYENTYPHNVVSFLPHMIDTDVIDDNDSYRALDYYFVMGEKVSGNNTIKYKKVYHELSNDPDDRYYIKLYLDEGDQINVEQYNFDTRSTETTTLNLVKDAGDLTTTLDTGVTLNNYYCLVDTPSFKQNMLFQIVDVGKEKLVIDEGNVEEYSIKVLSGVSSIDPSITSYITFTTIQTDGTKTIYCLWFNTGTHSQPSVGADVYIEVDISDSGIVTATDIADKIDEVLTESGGILGIDFGTGGYSYNGTDTITLVNEGDGSLTYTEKIETNDYETFYVKRNVVGTDDTLTTEQLVYVKLRHIEDPYSKTVINDSELETKLIYHNENYKEDQDSGKTYELDFLENMLEDFDEVRVDQFFDVYRRVLYDADGNGLPDLVPDPAEDGEFIDDTDLDDGELVQITGIHVDFDNIYRIATNGVDYTWLKTDIKSDTDVSSRFSSEIPYLTGSYTLELPGKLDKEPRTEHRLYWEVEKNDVVVNKDQILILDEDDIEITTEKVIVEDSKVI